MHAASYFAQLSRYHCWATARLLAALAPLPDADYYRDVGLFFHSIHGTLNHLAVGEGVLWYHRFRELTPPALALDDTVETDRMALADRITQSAQNWQTLIASWPETHYDDELAYRTTKGQPVRLPFSPTLAHVFNHATHHRGQITAAITHLKHPGPELDMVYFLQEEYSQHG